MKLAVITDSSAYLDSKVIENEHLFVLDIPVSIDGIEYIEGKNLSASEFYQKMAASSELPKTSQPSIASLVNTLSLVEGQGYTHVIGLFLSSGISGFYQNIQYLKDEFPSLEIAFPDSKITSAPLGMMVEHILNWTKQGLLFEQILNNLEVQIKGIGAFIMVDDLNHLVRGGRISKAAAVIGSLASIKPIITVQADGSLKPIAKVRGKKKAQAECVRMLLENIANERAVIAHANAVDAADNLKELLLADGRIKEVLIEPLGPVIATHVGPGTLALFGFSTDDRE